MLFPRERRPSLKSSLCERAAVGAASGFVADWAKGMRSQYDSHTQRLPLSVTICFASPDDNPVEQEARRSDNADQTLVAARQRA